MSGGIQGTIRTIILPYTAKSNNNILNNDPNVEAELIPKCLSSLVSMPLFPHLYHQTVTVFLPQSSTFAAATLLCAAV